MLMEKTVVKTQKNKVSFLVDMGVPTDCNVSLKMFKNISKYKHQ